MKSFARVTKLSNIGGRADYISNPERQESIVALSPDIDWEPYQDYERTHKKTAVANNEGREVVISLPNEWEQLTHDELNKRAQTLAVTAAGKESDMQWAVHWNKTHTNLHLHVIFSERQKEGNTGRYDRNVYLTNTGKIARSKADRATDTHGNIKPPIHRKGEVKGGFTAKDTRYKSRAWVYTMKEDLRQEFTRHGVRIEEPMPLYQYHEGKGKESPQISEKNIVIRENNVRIKALEKAGYTVHAATDMLSKSLGDRLIPVLHVQEGKLKSAAFETPNKAIEFMERTRSDFSLAITPRREESVRPFSLTALIEAQREYYCQTYALNDKRKPPNKAVVDAPAKCKQALKNLEEARNNRSSAQHERSKCYFWQRDKKSVANVKITKAENDCQTAFDTLRKYGVSTCRDNVPMNGRNLSDDDMHYIMSRANNQIDDLQRKAEREAKFALPSNALKGSQEAQNASKMRFVALCRDIPPDRRKEATEALKDAMRNNKRGGNVQGFIRAFEAVQQVVNKELPQVRDLSRTQKRGRSR